MNCVHPVWARIPSFEDRPSSFVDGPIGACLKSPCLLQHISGTSEETYWLSCDSEFLLSVLGQHYLQLFWLEEISTKKGIPYYGL